MRKLLFCSAIFLAACSDSTAPKVATTIAVSPGSATLDAVGARQVVRAAVADQNGRALSGQTLTWTSSSAAVTVAGAGGDSAFVTAASAGSARITATAGKATGAADVQVTQIVTGLVPVSTPQNGTVGQPLATPVRVRAVDRLGVAVPGVNVSFVVAAGGGSVSSATAQTSTTDGTATTGWTLGTVAGTPQTLVASIPGGPVAPLTFTATASAGLVAAIALLDGNNQSGTAGSSLPLALRVRATDAYGNPASGGFVLFSVTAGNGTVNGVSNYTAPVSNGIASGSLTLAATGGAHSVSVFIPNTNFPPVVFNATSAAVTNVPATITLNAGENQAAMASTALPLAPSVLVRTAAGTPAAGVPVTFSVTGGGGSVTPTVMTNASGIAAAQWTLGPEAGPNTLSARVGTLTTQVNFRASGCTGGGAGFQITFCVTTPMTASQIAVFRAAAARWSTVITGELGNVAVTFPEDACDTGSPRVQMEVDDLLIFAAISPIDGPGQVLGQAGWCARRTGSLPVFGIMEFDVADVASLERTGGLSSVILHEMGHVLGIGSLWAQFGFLQNPSSNTSVLDTYFTGPGGIAGFNAIGGSSYTGGQKVPVENTGGGGTANSHWRENVLQNELMTGYLNNGNNPLSILTVRSLGDLGYVVDPAAADPFSVLLSIRQGTSAPTLRMHNDLYKGPAWTIDRLGRRTRVR